MKTTQAKHKLSTTLATALGTLLLTSAARAQNHYDWTISDDMAEWGVKESGGGTYTQDKAVWSGAYGVFGMDSLSYDGGGPYDRRTGILIFDAGTTGIMTRTDPSAIFGLSAVGSSATIRTAYHFFARGPGDSGGHAHMYQFGLTNNASYLGKAGNESLLVAADFQNYDGSGIMTLDLDLLDHTGLDTTGDGNWTPASLYEVANSLTLEGISGSDHQSRPGKSQAVELTYTNLGNGKLKVDVGVTDLYISGSEASDTLTSSNQVVQKSYVIDHSFSDLSALRPGFGVTLNDGDIPISAAHFDWEDAYPTGFSVPEPSSASLLGLGIAGFFLRRKRK